MVRLNLPTLLLLLVILPATLLAAKEGEDSTGQNFYDHSYLGEQESFLYYGPNSADQVRESADKKPQFVDQLYLERYQDKLIPAVPSSLENLINDQLQQGSCPNEVLGQHITYLRYINRLITISYLYEELKFLKRIYYGVGGKKAICAESIGAILNQCQRSKISSEMRKFLERSKLVLAQEKLSDELRRFKQQEIAEILRRVNGGRVDRRDGLQLVMDWYCQEYNICSSFAVGDLRQAVEKRCMAERQLISDICSEVDQVFGLSGQSKVIPLLTGSNIKNIFLSREQLQGCLVRYRNIFISRERRYSVLDQLFSIVYMELSRYPTGGQLGVLFIPGALKEFDDLGLKDFIYRPKPEPVKVVKKIPLPIKPKKVVPPPPKKKIVKIAPKPKPKPTPKPKPKVKPLSAFELAVAIRNKNDLPRYPVDMDIFKRSFSFTSKQKAVLEDALTGYQTQKALRQMKSGDGLGGRDEPVLLLFVKYLIDSGQHQGLYNIQSVLGKSFFLLNDIDKKKIPAYVELKNDKSTGYLWQINILPTPEPEEGDESE
jgi:hypothetical protein